MKNKKPESPKDFKDVRTTRTQEEINQIEAIAKELRMQGKSDEEAQKLAEEQMKRMDEAAEQGWEDFIKRMNIGDVVDDLIRRSLIKYKQEVLKINPNSTVDFKIDLSRKRHPTNVISLSAAVLTFSMNLDGKWHMVAQKTVTFADMKEAKDEKSWKFGLYEALFQTLVFNGIQNIITSYYVRKQQKEEISSAPQPQGTETPSVGV
jgi:hypothetical protein